MTLWLKIDLVGYPFHSVNMQGTTLQTESCPARNQISGTRGGIGTPGNGGGGGGIRTSGYGVGGGNFDTGGMGH